MAAGISFCRAANDVVLSEGPISLKFVRRIEVRFLLGAATDAVAGWLICAPAEECTKDSALAAARAARGLAARDSKPGGAAGAGGAGRPPMTVCRAPQPSAGCIASCWQTRDTRHTDRATHFTAVSKVL